MGCLHTEDLKGAIFFHNSVFISQKHLVAFQIIKEKKVNARKAKNKISKPFFCFRIFLAKQMQKKVNEVKSAGFS